jgi:hypothetical protein
MPISDGEAVATISMEPFAEAHLYNRRTFGRGDPDNYEYAVAVVECGLGNTVSQLSEGCL